MQHTVRCEASCILSTTCSCGTTKTSGKSTVCHPRNAHISATSQHCLAAMQHIPVQMPHSFAGRIPSVADRYLFVCALVARPKTGHPAPKCIVQAVHCNKTADPSSNHSHVLLTAACCLSPLPLAFRRSSQDWSPCPKAASCCQLLTQHSIARAAKIPWLLLTAGIWNQEQQ